MSGGETLCPQPLAHSAASAASAAANRATRPPFAQPLAQPPPTQTITTQKPKNQPPQGRCAHLAVRHDGRRAGGERLDDGEPIRLARRASHEGRSALPHGRARARGRGAAEVGRAFRQRARDGGRRAGSSEPRLAENAAAASREGGAVRAGSRGRGRAVGRGRRSRGKLREGSDPSPRPAAQPCSGRRQR